MVLGELAPVVEIHFFKERQIFIMFIRVSTMGEGETNFRKGEGFKSSFQLRSGFMRHKEPQSCAILSTFGWKKSLLHTLRHLLYPRLQFNSKDKNEFLLLLLLSNLLFILLFTLFLLFLLLVHYIFNRFFRCNIHFNVQIT